MFLMASVHFCSGTRSTGLASGSALYGLAVGQIWPAGGTAPERRTLAHPPLDRPTTIVPPCEVNRFIASVSDGSGAATLSPNRSRTRCLMASSEQRGSPPASLHHGAVASSSVVSRS